MSELESIQAWLMDPIACPTTWPTVPLAHPPRQPKLRGRSWPRCAHRVRWPALAIADVDGVGIGWRFVQCRDGSRRVHHLCVARRAVRGVARISCPARERLGERTAVNLQCVRHVQYVQHDANLIKFNRIHGTNLLYLVSLHA